MFTSMAWNESKPNECSIRIDIRSLETSWSCDIYLFICFIGCRKECLRIIIMMFQWQIFYQGNTVRIVEYTHQGLFKSKKYQQINDFSTKNDNTFLCKMPTLFAFFWNNEGIWPFQLGFPTISMWKCVNVVRRSNHKGMNDTRFYIRSKRLSFFR